MANARRQPWTIPIFLVSLAMFSIGGVIAQAPMSAPSPSPDCTNALSSLLPCLSYVLPGSNMTVPDTGCCSGLSGIVSTTPVCLCELLGSSDTYGIQIDRTKALTLPTVCRVQTPPLSACSVLGVPVASPPSPTMAPTSGGPEMPESPATGSTPTMGSGMPPASTPNNNDGSSSFRSVSGPAILAGLSWAYIAIF